MFFNKVEEVKCAASVALCQRRVKTDVEHGLCDCISIGRALNQRRSVGTSVSSSMTRPLVTGSRVIGSSD